MSNGGWLHDDYLEAMGIQRWLLREPRVIPGKLDSEVDISTKLSAASDKYMSPTDNDWEPLRAAVAGCTRCGLHKSRTQTVFGVGRFNADWMIIGEAPGADEDIQGEPFVGRAGRLLNAMLLAIGLQREEVFIANILKCRPPNNRDPQASEVACCEPYLQRQIELIRPRIILAVGRIAAQNLLKTETSIGRLRGRIHRLPGADIPLVVTYHPAYLLRKPSDKRKAWDDLKLAQGCMST